MERLERHAKGHEDKPDAEALGGLSAYEDDLRERLKKAVFVGHINTDLDSVAGAIGAATLFGGTASLAEPYDKLNGEITFALDNCGLEPPKYFDAMDHSDDCDVCLVDHTEEKQMVPSLRDSSSRTNRIVGVIDHHALAKSFSSTRPIYMDLRPWGSMCTIVGYLFISHRKALPKPLAVLLLQAILSDTLNLRSITTTDADRSMVALLVS
jgi:inorganic pyrophosphatase/exopolyphosphatase